MFTEPDFQDSCSYWTCSVIKWRIKFTVLCTETGFVVIRVVTCCYEVLVWYEQVE